MTVGAAAAAFAAALLVPVARRGPGGQGRSRGRRASGPGGCSPGRRST
ncbi:MAG: hypothetical protein M0C28_15555 [Candidatus Moduliflexus flocculans]|nr:hypothetical protein [Candidatus Moduliflexus flocculans]